MTDNCMTSVRRVCLTAFSSSASSASAEPLAVGRHDHLVEPPDPPGPVGGGLPAADQLRDQLVERDRLRVQERRVGGGGDDQQPLGDAAQPVQLADDDVDVLGLPGWPSTALASSSAWPSAIVIGVRS